MCITHNALSIGLHGTGFVHCVVGRFWAMLKRFNCRLWWVDWKTLVYRSRGCQKEHAVVSTGLRDQLAQEERMSFGYTKLLLQVG
jgi:hypothetical protein